MELEEKINSGRFHQMKQSNYVNKDILKHLQ